MIGSPSDFKFVICIGKIDRSRIVLVNCPLKDIVQKKTGCFQVFFPSFSCLADNFSLHFSKATGEKQTHACTCTFAHAFTKKV